MTLARVAKQLVVQEAFEIYHDENQPVIQKQRCNATYNCVLGIVLVKVNTADIHRRIGRRSGDNDFFGAPLQVSRSPAETSEDMNDCLLASITHLSIVVNTP